MQPLKPSIFIKQLIRGLFIFGVFLFIFLAYKVFDNSFEKISKARNKNLSVGINFIYVEEASDSKVLIKRNSGSGIVFWHSGYILTAAHLVNESPSSRIIVTTFDNGVSRHHYAQILARNKTMDIMAIKIPYDFGTETPLEDSNRIEPWEEIYTVGCPFGACNTYTEGNYFTHGGLTLYKSNNYIFFDVPVINGSSGQGVFNGSGNLVGISTDLHKIQNRLSFATSSNAIREFLNKNDLPYRDAIHLW
ncbi:MAG: trypsin-like peptidase domain-containing protein [Parcubacteria group bacterium]|nr:trypsin-like peptidase domain-containing protein [Parcubacteria group bacterium]